MIFLPLILWGGGGGVAPWTTFHFYSAKVCIYELTQFGSYFGVFKITETWALTKNFIINKFSWSVVLNLFYKDIHTLSYSEASF